MRGDAGRDRPNWRMKRIWLPQKGHNFNIGA